MKITWVHRWPLLASLLLIALLQRLAPWARAEGTDWFHLNGLPDVSVGVEAEGTTEETRLSGGSYTFDHLYLTPLVGLHSTGYIYHPNLLTFDLSGDLGWGWDNTSSRSSAASQSRDESAELLRYLAEFNLLSTKPYNASFFAAQDHTYRDYGSFNTFTVDATRYGGRANWNVDGFSLNSDFGYRDENASGLNDASEISEMYFNFLGIHQRKSGQTTLNLHASELDNVVNHGQPLNTRNWSAGLSDSETFGHRKQFTAGTGLSYSQSVYTGQQIDTLNASENLLANLRPQLDSFLMFDFNRSEYNPISSLRLQGTGGLRHQLFESLTSSLDVHGTHQEDSGSGGGSTFQQYGVGLSENYLKRLQSWGRLTLNAGVIVDHLDQSAAGSGIVTVFDEAHQLYLSTSPGYRPDYLNRPRVVDSSIMVRAGTDTLVNDTDYRIVHSGELTEIKLVVPPGAHLQSLLQTNDNLAVTVNYRSDSGTSSAYDTFNASLQVRVDLFNRVGLYGRINRLDNNAPPSVLTQTLTQLVAGLDYTRHWLRAGAEYENYDSNFTKYEAWRLYQNFDFRLTGNSTLSLTFDESFYHYPLEGDQTQYQMVTRYNIQIWSSLSWYAQGGCILQNVPGTEQVLGSAQTGLNWTRGKLSLRTGYEYNSQSTTANSFREERVKNRVFAYLKRTF